MTRAAIYLRISLDQTGEGLGVSRQLEDCEELAKTLEWDVAETYTDNDISATSGRVRPAYRRMLADIEAGLIDGIVVWSPDRLYRRAADLETLIPVIDGHGVLVRTVKAGDLDLSSAYGRMIARILGAIATGEGEVKAERWKRSWRQGREAGKFPATGNRMFGWTREGQPIPEEVRIARWMAEFIANGGTQYQLEGLLDDRGIRTTKGLPWRAAGVRAYLTNPRLVGKSTLRGEVVGEGDWEPIIDKDLWETSRAVILARATGVAQVRRSILNGLIFCGKCRFRMITGGSRGKRLYRCPKRSNMDGCGSVSGFADPIEEIVESYAQTRLADPRVIQRAAELEHGGGAAEVLAEINALEARLRELDASLEEPGVPVKQIARAITRTDDRLKEAQAELAKVATRSVPLSEIRTGGYEWPTSLASRRALIEVALGSERIYLMPAGERSNVFRVERVVICGPESFTPAP